MTTVSAVTNAVKEAAQRLAAMGRTTDMESERLMLEYLSKSPTACTLIANSLSDMGRAGNAARDRNLAQLRNLAKHGDMTVDDRETLAWAIDQLSQRPLITNERIMPVEGCYCRGTCGAPVIMGRQTPCLRNPAYPITPRAEPQMEG